MATSDEAQAALLDAMVVCANAISTKQKELNATTAERYGQAALHLAEAAAWLQHPAQPHGGGTYTSA